MQRLAASLIFVTVSFPSLAQVTPQSLPETIAVRMYPDGRFPGYQLEFTRFSVSGSNVTALVTMRGAAADRPQADGR